MSTVETIHEPGDLVYTMSEGRVRVFVVDDAGAVREVAPDVVQAMR